MTFILLLLLIATIAFALLTYSRLLLQIDSIRSHQQHINTLLDRRSKIFESLINAVQKNMDFEKTTLKDVATLRNQAQQAKLTGDEKSRILAENQISAIANNIHHLFDEFPMLKQNPQCLLLQKEIQTTENNLAYSKQSYNDSIDIYKINKQSFPASMIVNALKTKLDNDFPYWQLDTHHD